MLLILLRTSICRAFPSPQKVTGDTAVHDPTICKDDRGKYWVFSTGAGLEIRTSMDRVAWTLVGTVWPDGAPWTDSYTGISNGSLWAPDCTYKNGEFYLYYAASSFGSQDSAVFLAKSATGLPRSWKDEGLVISTSSSDNYNAIDPNLIIVNGQWYLSLGSFWTGIKLVHLNEYTGKLFTPTALTPLAQRTANNGAIEASVIYQPPFPYPQDFYLFTSWDNCCQGVNSTYNVRVGRASEVNGTYLDYADVPLTSGGGTLVLGTHDNIVGPGGQDLFTDEDGPIIVYHYYTTNGSFLGINRLDFLSGWPIAV